jgi:hypothetical protein
VLEIKMQPAFPPLNAVTALHNCRKYIKEYNNPLRSAAVLCIQTRIPTPFTLSVSLKPVLYQSFNYKTPFTNLGLFALYLIFINDPSYAKTHRMEGYFERERFSPAFSRSKGWVTRLQVLLSANNKIGN